MASVLEYVSDYLGLGSRSHNTQIAQLGISDRISILEAESRRYFEIPQDAQASDERQAVIVRSANKFNPMNPDHTRYLSNCTQLFQEKSKALKEIDQRIMMGVVVGVVAASLSFLPLVGLLSVVGWAVSVYYVYQRKTAYDEYTKSLNLLVANCNWSLGKVEEAGSPAISKLTSNTEIREMMTELYPVLTKTDVENLVANDIEQIYLAELRNYENKFKPGGAANRFFPNENIALSKKGAEFTRCIYGYNKGNATDFLDAFLSILPDLWHAAQHGIQRIKNWMSKDVAQSDVNSAEAPASR